MSLCIKCGLSYQEFDARLRIVFVRVASDDYGLRGRPTNMSRVAAMTGISRKEIRKIRAEGNAYRWTPAMELSPGNLLLHYWHYDTDFYEKPGVASPLPLEGDRSFSALIRRYAGDIPVGAVKEELRRAGVIDEHAGVVRVRKRYFQPEEFDDDFIRNIAFSIKNVATTAIHNADLVSRSDFTQALNENRGRFERFAWSDHLSQEARETFRQWVRQEGANFIERADHWIGENEISNSTRKSEKTIGVGLYYFEDD